MSDYFSDGEERKLSEGVEQLILHQRWIKGREKSEKSAFISPEDLEGR